jgi:Tfp pilus assembly protein FimT
MNAGQRHHRARGVTLLELIIVAAVSLLVAAILLPNVINAVYNIRLRAAANDLAGLYQDAHFRAIRDNTYYLIRSATIGNSTVFYIDTTAAHNGTSWANGYPTVQLGGNITWATSGYPAVTSMSLGFVPLVATSLPYFSARGTPCSVSGNTCLNTYTSGPFTIIACYQTFLTDTRPTGSNGWAAVTVSPAGRVRVWMWDGTKWE